jgi:hypothetical protein
MTVKKEKRYLPSDWLRKVKYDSLDDTPKEIEQSRGKFFDFPEEMKGYQFEIPLIEKTMNALKPNCTFVLNIGDRRYPLSKVLLENFGDKYQIIKLKDRLINYGLNRVDGKGSHSMQ